jgi:uncharacterized protein
VPHSGWHPVDHRHTSGYAIVSYSFGPVGIKFEWDPEKAESNLRKHGVSFPEAATVFSDPLSITVSDPQHSTYEERLVLFGRSAYGRLLAVIHTAKGIVIRIISARPMTPRERREYEEGGS